MILGGGGRREGNGWRPREKSSIEFPDDLIHRLSGSPVREEGNGIHRRLTAETNNLTGSLAARQAELLSPLAALRDPQARLAWLIERARQRPPLPEVFRQEAHRVAGCLVRLWFVPEFRAGRCWFHTDSDAVTLKALVGLLSEVYSGGAPVEIVRHPPDFLHELGLLRHVAENRRATILRVADQIQSFAAAQRMEASGSLIPRPVIRSGN